MRFAPREVGGVLSNVGSGAACWRWQDKLDDGLGATFPSNTSTGPLADVIPGNTTSLEVLSSPGSRSSIIDTVGDQDWFQITLNPSQQYTLSVTGALSSPYLSLYSTSGSLITSDADGNWPSLITGGGSFFLAVGGNGGATGAYTVTITSIGQDAIWDGVGTNGQLTINGASVASAIETGGDQDWFRVDLVAGQSYQFMMTGAGGPSTLSDPYLELRNAAGELIAVDDDGGVGSNSRMQFTAVETGVYYLNAKAYGLGQVGNYTISAANGPPQNPLDTLDLEFTFGTTNINVYFATSGQDIGPLSAALRSWNSLEIAAVMSALQTIADVTNLTFTQVGTSAGAHFIMALTDLADNVLGITYPSPSQAHIAFAPDAPGWGFYGLEPGGLGYSVIIHEVGHALGLDHPHMDGLDVQVMQGVIDPFGSYGTFLMNQGVFTIMSYNDGWALGPHGAPTSTTSGYSMTPMALDIAMLQSLYGADPNRNSGDDVYSLRERAAYGYVAIWDTGGSDTIVYDGLLSATIDLRAATLLSEIGGGGFVSHTSGPRGGYTIAAGVVIENATGGSGNDTLVGNAANNVLTGNGGNDRMDGGAGDDVIITDGSDDLAFIFGGDGADLFVFTSGSAPSAFDLGGHGFESAQAWLVDTGANAWAEQTDYYNTQWQLLRSHIVNDDATSVEIYFDVADSLDWVTNWNHYAAGGGRDINTVTYDDGASDVLFLDPADALNWITNWNRYDALGERTINTVTYDDGMTEVLHFDPHDTLNWETNWRQLDALERILINTVTYDDGVSEVVYHDVTNAQNWTTNWNQYAAGGQLAINAINFDNGTSVTLHYDYAGVQAWASNWNRYDALGRLDMNSLTFDDGRYSVVDYDQANAHAWATIWSLYDANDNLLATQTTNDDGSVYP